jgi:hypothetical protein
MLQKTPNPDSAGEVMPGLTLIMDVPSTADISVVGCVVGRNISSGIVE